MPVEGVETRAEAAEVFQYVMTTAGLLEEDIEWLRTTSEDNLSSKTNYDYFCYLSFLN